jgi:hypothetical protein
VLRNLALGSILQGIFQRQLFNRDYGDDRLRRYPAVGSSDLKGWNPLISLSRPFAQFNHRKPKEHGWSPNAKTPPDTQSSGVETYCIGIVASDVRRSSRPLM